LGLIDETNYEPIALALTDEAIIDEATNLPNLIKSSK